MLELLQQYQYIFLFLGLLFGGESVLVPAVYLAVVGTFAFTPLIVITVVATIISDSIWYALGRFKNWQQLQKYRVINKQQKTFNEFSRIFERKALLYLFLSKFVYGTRILAQVLSGAHKIPFYLYTLVNTAAVLVWAGVLITIGYIFKTSFNDFEGWIHYLQVFVAFIVVIIVINLWLHKTIKKNWFRQ